jgi:hypothetical protein
MRACGARLPRGATLRPILRAKLEGRFRRGGPLPRADLRPIGRQANRAGPPVSRWIPGFTGPVGRLGRSNIGEGHPPNSNQYRSAPRLFPMQARSIRPPAEGPGAYRALSTRARTARRIAAGSSGQASRTQARPGSSCTNRAESSPGGSQARVTPALRSGDLGVVSRRRSSAPPAAPAGRPVAGGRPARGARRLIAARRLGRGRPVLRDVPPAPRLPRLP